MKKSRTQFFKDVLWWSLSILVILLVNFTIYVLINANVIGETNQDVANLIAQLIYFYIYHFAIVISIVVGFSKLIQYLNRKLRLIHVVWIFFSTISISGVILNEIYKTSYTDLQVFWLYPLIGTCIYISD